MTMTAAERADILWTAMERMELRTLKSQCQESGAWLIINANGHSMSDREAEVLNKLERTISRRRVAEYRLFKAYERANHEAALDAR